MSHRYRNCTAFNNLCLFATFPCGWAQRPIIIYAHRTLPVSKGRSQFAQTVCQPRQWTVEAFSGWLQRVGPDERVAPWGSIAKMSETRSSRNPNSCGVSTMGRFWTLVCLIFPKWPVMDSQQPLCSADHSKYIYVIILLLSCSRFWEEDIESGLSLAALGEI